MSKSTIEQKLRNLQINLAQGRTNEELAQAGIYFPSSTSLSQQQNAFSNYIDSVHRALDSSKQQQQPSNENSTNIYHESPYHNDTIQYDYKRQPSFQSHFNQPNEQRNYFYDNPSLSLANVVRPSVPTQQS